MTFVIAAAIIGDSLPAENTCRALRGISKPYCHRDLKRLI
jgi:hypothetical protein